MCSDFIFNLFPLPLSSEKKDLRVFGDFFPPPTNLCSGALYFTLQLILISFMIRGRLDLQNSGTSFMMSCIPSMKAGWHFLQCSLFPACFLVLFLLLTGLPISHTECQPLLSEETKHLRTELLHLLSGCDVMSHRLQHSRRQQAKKLMMERCDCCCMASLVCRQAALEAELWICLIWMRCWTLTQPEPLFVRLRSHAWSFISIPVDGAM